MAFMFEEGKTYNTLGGGIALVESIEDDPRDRYPMAVRMTMDGSSYGIWLSKKGKNCHIGDSPYDLLLPAIEPERERFSGPTVASLTAYLDFWLAFRGDVIDGLIDPCGNGYFLLSDGARIMCGYESREAALAECRQIIESIDHLLEGGAA